MARNEDEISLLAAKALTLLKEEGSSVAFPEAVEQIRDDMLTVARRLERVDVGEITQNIEQDIARGNGEYLTSLGLLLNISAAEQEEESSEPEAEFWEKAVESCVAEAESDVRDETEILGVRRDERHGDQWTSLAKQALIPRLLPPAIREARPTTSSDRLPLAVS